MQCGKDRLRPANRFSALLLGDRLWSDARLSSGFAKLRGRYEEFYDFWLLAGCIDYFVDREKP
jgi:hypothetical protein